MQASLPARTAKRLPEGFAAYVEAHDSLPPAHEIFEMLDPDKAFHDARPWIDESRKAMRQISSGDTGETEREMAMRQIRRGALQAVASVLLDQTPHIAMGEHDIHEGIRLLKKARAMSSAYYSNPKRSKITIDEVLEELKGSKRKTLNQKRKTSKPKRPSSDDFVL